VEQNDLLEYLVDLYFLSVILEGNLQYFAALELEDLERLIELAPDVCLQVRLHPIVRVAPEMTQ